MFLCCQLPQPWSALVAAATLTLVAAAPSSPADTSSLAPRMCLNACAAAPIEPSSPPVALGLRTDRLSARQRERWHSIAGLALAKDDSGRLLHPTLGRMWDEVAASGHEVYVELPPPSPALCNAAGAFRIESVRPDGHIVAVVRLNLKTIEWARVGDATHRGFPRFHGLGLEGRYAEVLGHELAHAVWTLAEPARARQFLALQSELVDLGRSLRKAKREGRAEILRHLTELDEEFEALEPLARAAEARVWRELLASQAARGVRNASSLPSPPQP